MPSTTMPAIGFTLSCPNATTLVTVGDPTYGADAVYPPDNCHTIVIYNLDEVNRVFVRFGLKSQVTVGNTTLSSSTVLPALGSMTFQIGHVVERGFMAVVSDLGLFLLPEAGGPVLVNITYLMGSGRTT